MTSTETEPLEDELAAEYVFDYSKAGPNRFASRMDRGSMGVLLAPDVAAAFSASDAVNEALRGVLRSPNGGASEIAPPGPKAPVDPIAEERTGNERFMRETTDSDDDDMPAEYDIDFSKARSNPYASEMKNRVAVLLDPDVAAAFPSSEAVNDALREYLRIRGSKNPDPQGG